MLTKTRHNKKRNTAFLYEALVRELTKCIVTKDEERKGIIISLVKEHFTSGTILRKELDLYRALYETEDFDVHTYEKLIYEVKLSHSQLDREAVFKEQTALINKINKSLSKGVFSNFVPNYKDLATISQILNPDVSVKHRVLLENSLVSSLSHDSADERQQMTPIDNLVYKTFVNKFNERYNDTLLEVQRELLNKYITSFHDDGFEFKIYLNEELGRLKTIISKFMKSETATADNLLFENSNKVLLKLEEYRDQEINETLIQDVLKVQNLVEELHN
jgi:hypothetical protein